MTESIIHKTQNEGACNVPLPTAKMQHFVAKDHKKCTCGLKKTKGPCLWSHTYIYIYTHIHIYISKVNFYPLYFGQLWTHWFNRLSQHVHTRTHTNHFY